MSNKPMVMGNLPRSILGEGPIWDNSSNTLYWVDILGDRIHYHSFNTGQSKTLNVSPYPSCVMLNDDENLVVTIKDKVILLNPVTGSVIKTIASISEPQSNRFNDCKCDPSGRLIAGTMDMNEKAPTGSLYAIESNGSVRRILESVTISNGIAWSSDGTLMYYIDSPTRRVSILNYDPRNGVIKGQVGYVDLSNYPGVPDGMTIDSEGYIWVAMYGGGVVLRIDTEDKRVVDKIEVDAKYTTSCTFGGPNLSTLFITTATDRSRQTQGPDGYPFRLDTNVRGTLINRCHFH